MPHSVSIDRLTYPCVMGVINVTPHSFYNALPDPTGAFKTAEAMVNAGAQIIDVGAVATNPLVNLSSSSNTPSESAELDALIPLVERLASQLDVMISVDTSRATVMQATLEAGAHMINDQRALTEEQALETAVKLKAPVCLMHHFNPVRQPGCSTSAELLTRIKNDLQEYIARCRQAGMKKENIIIDPGFGSGHFGKNAEENFYVLSHLDELSALGYPVLVGLSRKMMLGGVVEDRLLSSVVAATIAAMKGASILRVHDVKETVDAMRIVTRVMQ